MMAKKYMRISAMPGKSFFDSATTTDAARLLDLIYGPGAARACIECALAAKLNDCQDDVLFWYRVLQDLRQGNFPEFPATWTIH